MGLKVQKKTQTRALQSHKLSVRRTEVWVSLTETEQNQRDLGERCVGRREVEFRLGPSQSVLVDPGQNVVPAQSFGLGHQLLLCQRPVEHVQDLRSKHRGPPQDVHVLPQGDLGQKVVDL